VKRGDWLAIILYAAAAIATGFVDLRVRAYPDYAFKTYVPAVLDGSYGAPAIYRVLMPYTLDWLTRATGLPAAAVWHLSRLLLCAAAYLVFHWYLRTWFSPLEATTGTFVLAALFPLTFTNSWAHPDHFAELLLFTAGCAAIARGRDWLFAAVLILATLNRETSVFLVLLYAIARPLSTRHIGKTAAIGSLWLVLFAGLRVLRGFENYEYWQLSKNIEFLKLLPPPRDPYYRAYAWFGVVLAGPLLAVALLRKAMPPLFIRRALWVVPMFGVVAFTISSIIESRIFTPLFALIIPAALFSLTYADRDVPEIIEGSL
jgi:hypothetical protein